MKKCIATIFLFVYLISTTQWDQLMKLPVVFQHYHEHIRMEGKISFLGFLAEHYIHSEPGDPDYARDMQLPFKTASHSFFILIPAAPPRPEIAALPVIMNWQEQQFALDPSAITSTGFHTGIFQPPRIPAS